MRLEEIETQEDFDEHIMKCFKHYLVRVENRRDEWCKSYEVMLIFGAYKISF